MIALALKATFVLVAAACAAACLHRRSAAMRHFVWTAALAALLLLPVASLAPRPSIEAPAIVVRAVAETQPASAPARQIPWLPIGYAAGAALSAAWFLGGAWRTARLVRRATSTDLDAGFGVTVLASSEAPVPLAWGILRPIVLLPAGALSWPAAQLRSVILHEATHHRRRDLLAQAIAQTACCLYWFHPLAWVALARQRAERERACDDAVVRNGVPAHDYAGHLLDVVRAVAASRPRWSNAPGMAEGSHLEARVRAILDRGADRGPLNRRAALAVGAAVLLLLAPLSLTTLRAQAGGGITGVVEDPSGARIPNCKVTATNIDGTNVEVTTADAAGEYSFSNVPSGRYVLEFSTRGFRILKLAPAEYVRGAALRLDAHMEIGGATETVSVVGRRSAPIVPPARPAAAPRRIPVGGNVQPMRLVRQPRPAYPVELQQAGVEGTVVIRAVVSKEGTVLRPQVVNTVDPRLAQAALDAVADWRYTPTLLNGQPVETLTTINVEFHLDQ